MIDRFFDIAADRYPDRTAVYEKNRAFTYAETMGRIQGMAAALCAIPLEKKDRVVIALGNVIEYIVAYFSVLKAGFIPVLIRTDMPPAKIAGVIEAVEAAGVIGHAWVFNALPACPPHLRFAFLDGPLPEALWGISAHRFIDALDTSPGLRESRGAAGSAAGGSGAGVRTIIFTSGTSGTPKGVILSAENLEYSTGLMVDYLHLCPDDCSLVSIPFSHCAGLLHMLAHIRCGGRLVTGESPALPGSFLKAVVNRHVTGLPVVPSLMRLFVSGYKKDLAAYCSRLRYIEFSSEPCEDSLIQTLTDLLPDVSLYNTYGLTEAPRTTYHDIRNRADAITSVGRPNREVSVRILDSRGSACVPGQIGEICISGPNVAAGYWHPPEAAATGFTADGFKTGDLARQDTEGRIYLQGRKDKRIKINGEWVSPEEIELVISKIPGILKAEVYCENDMASGTRLCANITTLSHGMVGEKKIRQICRVHLEKYKIPARFIFTETAAERPETGAVK
jgi:long-chain acyl-CoA synthetase